MPTSLSSELIKEANSTLSHPALAPVLEKGSAITSSRPVSNWRAREQTVVRLVILIALYAITSLALLQPVDDPDIWWHVRTGQWIVDHGTVPTSDAFSTFGQGKLWIAYSWLFEVLVYGLHHGLGLLGIVLFRVLMGLAILAAVHRLVAKRERRFVRGTVLAALAFVALAFVFRERSWLFSILFSTLTLDAVLDLRRGRPSWSVLLLPLLFALWANIHVQFVNGFVLLGLACVAPLFDRILGLARSGEFADTAGTRGWWTLVGVTGACVLSTFLNPYGVRLYLPVLELPTQTGAFKLISELQAPAFRNVAEWAMLVLAGLAAFALGRRRRLSTFEVLLLISSAYFSFRSQRDLWLVVLAALAILVPPPQSLQNEATGEFLLTRWRLLLVAAGILIVLIFRAWTRNLTEQHLQELVAAEYPAQACAIIEDQARRGPLFNHYDWGGYLIWRLPKLPVAMDGRANLHGDERMQRSEDTWMGLPGWDADPELMAAGVVIAPARLPLASLLRLDQRFRCVYEDKVALVFVAREAERQALPPAAGNTANRLP